MPITNTFDLRKNGRLLNYNVRPSVNLNQNQPEVINGMQEVVSSSVGKTMQPMGQPQASIQPSTTSDNPNGAQPLA